MFPVLEARDLSSMSASSVAQNDPIGDEDFHDFSEDGKSIEIQDIHEVQRLTQPKNSAAHFYSM